MITAHTLIKNEENFIWYSVMSVIDYIDELLIWDTGSDDKTKEIVKEIIKKFPDKINYDEFKDIDEHEYSNLRQAMLDKTNTDWIMILDGDEIWWEDSIKNTVNFINNKGKNYEAIIVPTTNLVGDIFHYQESNAGQYIFGNKKGHYALRFINKNIPGLHIGDIYGKEGFFDNENKPIQNRDPNKIAFLDNPYLHATHLARSKNDSNVMQRNRKLKHELGIRFPNDFYYPESFFIEKPQIVPNIWKKTDLNFKIKAPLETPLKKIKRRIK